MKADPSSAPLYGCHTVALAPIERLLQDENPAALQRLFTAQEIADAGTGAGRVSNLAECCAAMEACCELFPRERASGRITPAGFAMVREADGVLRVDPGAEARAVLDAHRLEGIRVSITRGKTSVTAIARAGPGQIRVPWFGKALYHLLPYRHGVVLGNLRRVFGGVLTGDEIRAMAQAYYAHYFRFLMEFIRLPFMTAAQRKAMIRVENLESPLRAHARGNGVLLLTGHLGNFEVSTVAGLSQFPQYRGVIYFVRRRLKPRLLNEFITWRFRRAGFGTLAKRGSLDEILELLSGGAIIVFAFDQHAGRRDGIPVEFLGTPAGTFKSLALLALTTQAPIIPVCSWREPDGSHVLHFEDPLPRIECEDASEAIRLNTRAYNAALERMLLRHPEQWVWMHRRWKVRPGPTEAES